MEEKKLRIEDVPKYVIENLPEAQAVLLQNKKTKIQSPVLQLNEDIDLFDDKGNETYLNRGDYLIFENGKWRGDFASTQDTFYKKVRDLREAYKKLYSACGLKLDETRLNEYAKYNPNILCAELRGSEAKYAPIYISSLRNSYIPSFEVENIDGTGRYICVNKEDEEAARRIASTVLAFSKKEKEEIMKAMDTQERKESIEKEQSIRDAQARTATEINAPINESPATPDFEVPQYQTGRRYDEIKKEKSAPDEYRAEKPVAPIQQGNAVSKRAGQRANVDNMTNDELVGALRNGDVDAANVYRELDDRMKEAVESSDNKSTDSYRTADDIDTDARPKSDGVCFTPDYGDEEFDEIMEARESYYRYNS